MPFTSYDLVDGICWTLPGPFDLRHPHTMSFICTCHAAGFDRKQACDALLLYLWGSLRHARPCHVVKQGPEGAAPMSLVAAPHKESLCHTSTASPEPDPVD